MATHYMVTYVKRNGGVFTRQFEGAPDALEMWRLRPATTRFFMWLFPKSMKYRVYDVDTFKFVTAKNGSVRFAFYPVPVMIADDDETALAYARMVAVV